MRYREDVLMRCRCYVLLRRPHDVPIRCRGDVALRRLGDVPSRRRWVFQMRRNYDFAKSSCCQVGGELGASQRKKQRMRLNTDSWNADENDDVNSACREKKNPSFKRYDMSKWSFGDAILVTD